MPQKGEPDSAVFFEIPRKDLDTNHYRYWMDFEPLPKWLVEKKGNEEFQHMETGQWNEEGCITGNIGGDYIASCKFYKYDERDDRKRGVLIRDHYSPEDVEKVLLISRRFEDFLREEKVKYKRTSTESAKPSFPQLPARPPSR